MPTSTPIAGRSISFAWHAPPECPMRAAVLERAEHLMGGTPQSRPGPELVVTAVVERLGNGGWQLRFDSSRGAAPERRVSGDNCAQLADAAALLLALLIDPQIAAQTAEGALPQSGPTGPFNNATTKLEAPREPAPQAAERPSPPPLAATRRAVANGHEAREAWLTPKLEFGAELSVWEARLPKLAPGVVASVGTRLARLRLNARLGYFPEQTARTSPTENEAKIWFGSAGVLAAYRALTGPVELAPFVGLELGWMHARRSAVGASGNVLLLGLGAGLLADYRLNRGFFVQASLQGQVLASRPGFLIGSQDVHRPAAIGLQLGLGALWVIDPSL